MAIAAVYEWFLKADEYLNRDKRVTHLPLVGSPWTMFGLMVLYLVFVKSWGPRFMTNRAPYNLRRIIIAYNIMQIVTNLYVFIAGTKYSYWQSSFSWTCQEYNYEDRSEHLMKLRWPAYVYYISKYFDFLDTVFFVLRKKDRQITFLHVYHHASMILCVWGYLTLLYGSQSTLIGIVNSLIHVLMYTYYLAAILKPKKDWTLWKRRITKLQMVQFSWMVVHFAMPILNNRCGLNLGWMWAILLQNVAFLFLFGNFYYKSYVAKAAGVVSSASHTRKMSKRLQEATGTLRKIAEKVE